jgi:hypothetical protein
MSTLVKKDSQIAELRKQKYRGPTQCGIVTTHNYNTIKVQIIHNALYLLLQAIRPLAAQVVHSCAACVKHSEGWRGAEVLEGVPKGMC